MTPATAPAFARIGRRAFPLTTLAEASAAYVKTCGALDMGSRKAPSCTLLDANMKPVGYISYNGKAWLGDERDWRGDNPCIYNPYADAA